MIGILVDQSFKEHLVDGLKRRDARLVRAIDELLMAAHGLAPEESRDLVRYFPL